MDSIDAYPLKWPAHWRRRPAHQRDRAKFGRMSQAEGRSYVSRDALTLAQALRRLNLELGRLGARGVVVSSNVQLRLDGQPRSGQGQPKDPAVAVYFTLGGKSRCLPCDRWDRVEDNLAAVAKHVEAIRGMERWGVGNVEAMFQGFKALPGPEGSIQPVMTRDQAAAVIYEFDGFTSIEEILNDPEQRVDAVRSAKRKTHPDAGGKQEDFTRVCEAGRVLADNA
jgi:hypothetical protein